MFINGRLGCFHILAIVINAAINTGVPVSLGDPDFNSFGCMSRSVIAGSCSFVLSVELGRCYSLGVDV